MRLANGEFLPSELVVWAAGVKAPEVLRDLDGLEATLLNQLVVTPTLQTTRDPDIFAIGDCAACPREGHTAPVPPRAQAAHQQASHLLRQFRHRIAGKPLEPFVYRDLGSLVSLGEYTTVGNLMGFLVGKTFFIEGYFARLMYHFPCTKFMRGRCTEDGKCCLEHWRGGSPGDPGQWSNCTRPIDVVGRRTVRLHCLKGGENDEIVVVTGGMGGLGETICVKMAQAGYRVVATCSPGNTRAKEWLAAQKAQGFDFIAVPVDVADYKSCATACARIAAEVGPVDVLCPITPASPAT